MAAGHQILAEALAKQGIEHCFGIVGVPVIELGMSIQNSGIKYYGCRNEQGAAYSAQAVGYLTGRPGLCLSVSGPGMTNCISGLANAKENCWPMILIGGSLDLKQQGMGGFQEMDQVEAAKPHVKLAIRITSVKQIPFFVEKAVRHSLNGRPGPVYIDIPGDILQTLEDEDKITYLPKFENIVKFVPPQENIQQAIKVLKSANQPLVIIGKGAAYANASEELTQFINNTKLPFLPTPMGKGVVDDDHQSNVIPARSRALQNADVILLVGARLNWILHFGQLPRFRKDVKIIQIDISPEEFGQNVKNEVALCGDIKLVVKQLNEEVERQGKWKFDKKQWIDSLNKKVEENKIANKLLMEDKMLPMQYYSAYNEILKYLPKDFLLVGEGANTMDIGRTIINHRLPKLRLDAGTFGTMGLAMPFALAAKAVDPKRPVVAIVGDSSFGFSAMEMETATRYNLPFVVIIINNNGIFTGVEEIPEKGTNEEYPVTALNPKSQYELMAEAFGGNSYRAKTHDELNEALKKAFSNLDKLSVINVAISPTGARKPQEHQWLTKNEVYAKL